MSTTIQLPPQKPNKPPAPRNYSLTNEQMEIDVLKQRMYEIERSVAALGDILDKDNEITLEKIAVLRETAKENLALIRKNLEELSNMIYGQPLYFLPGLGVQVKNMNAVLEAMQAAEEARVNQIAGMKKAIYILTAIIAIPSLGTILPILGKLLEVL